MLNSMDLKPLTLYVWINLQRQRMHSIEWGPTIQSRINRILEWSGPKWSNGNVSIPNYLTGTDTNYLCHASDHVSQIPINPGVVGSWLPVFVYVHISSYTYIEGWIRSGAPSANTPSHRTYMYEPKKLSDVAKRQKINDPHSNLMMRKLGPR